MNKIEDFGVHADAYYQLKVEIYKTKTDERLLELLWNKYWVATLSQSLILSVRPIFRKELMVESIIRHRPDYKSK
jgi:COP9 signalosome complex subunit 5